MISHFLKTGVIFSEPIPFVLWYESLNNAEETTMDCIVVDPNVCGGKPVIRGTRIMVRNILGLVAGGCAI